MHRKDFIKNSGLAAASFAILPTGSLFDATADSKVKIALIGTGLRGQNHLELLLAREDVELVAICDIIPQKAIQKAFLEKNAGNKKPGRHYYRHTMGMA